MQHAYEMLDALLAWVPLVIIIAALIGGLAFLVQIIRGKL